MPGAFAQVGDFRMVLKRLPAGFLALALVFCVPAPEAYSSSTGKGSLWTYLQKAFSGKAPAKKTAAAKPRSRVVASRGSYVCSASGFGRRAHCYAR